VRERPHRFLERATEVELLHLKITAFRFDKARPPMWLDRRFPVREVKIMSRTHAPLTRKCRRRPGDDVKVHIVVKRLGIDFAAHPTSKTPRPSLNRTLSRRREWATLSIQALRSCALTLSADIALGDVRTLRACLLNRESLAHRPEHGLQQRFLQPGVPAAQRTV